MGCWLFSSLSLSLLVSKWKFSTLSLHFCSSENTLWEACSLLRGNYHFRGGKGLLQISYCKVQNITHAFKLMYISYAPKNSNY